MELVLSEFDTLLMYINLHTKSHIFLKIGIFCKKIIIFSSSAHLMKRSTFLPKFHFFCTKLTFLHQNGYWQKHLLLCLKVCPKTDAFCIKCYFLLKENNSTKNWHFSKTKIFIKKKNLISPLKSNIFENGDHLLQKWKDPSKWAFLQDFRFDQWSTHNVKINTSKTNCHFFDNWQLIYF